MEESFWETEAGIEAQQAKEQPEVKAEPEQRIASEAPPAQTAEARALTVSLDDFAGLEERILRAVTQLKQERQARMAAEAQAAMADAQIAEAAAQAAQAAAQATAAEAALHEELERSAQMKVELAALRAEREQVKKRVDKLLEQLDSLEL